MWWWAAMVSSATVAVLTGWSRAGTPATPTSTPTTPTVCDAPKIWRDTIFSFYAFYIEYMWIKWDVFENKFILLKRVSIFGNQFDIYIYIYMLKKKRESNVFFLRKEFPPPSLTDWKCWLDWQLFSSFVGTCTVLDTLLLIYNRTLSLSLTNNFEGKWMLSSSSWSITTECRG